MWAVISETQGFKQTGLLEKHQLWSRYIKSEGKVKFFGLFPIATYPSLQLIPSPRFPVKYMVALCDGQTSG